MEYGLWNLPTGLWAGGSTPSTPPELVGRTFYTPVNTSAPPQVYHNAGVPIDNMVNFSATNSPPSPRLNFRNQDYLTSLKGTMTHQNRTALPVPLSSVHDDRSQPVPQQLIQMNQDLLVEQSSMESVDSTIDSCQHQVSMPLPTMIEHHRNNDLSQLQREHSDSPVHNKKSKYKRRMSDSLNNDDNSDWEENNNSSEGIGTNVPQIPVKTEINASNDTQNVDYLSQQGFQQQMFNMSFNKMSSQLKHGVSEEEDDESDENQVQQVANYPHAIGNRSPLLVSSQGTSSSPGGSLMNQQQRVGYECGECGLIADTRPGLKKHILVYHPVPDPGITNALLLKMSTSAACPMASCRFRTTERDEMETHMARHVAEGFSPNGKKRTGPVSLQRVRYEREEYRCQMCAYSCTIEKAFYKHLKVHTLGLQTNQVKISCVICGKDRSSEVDMNKHMRKHRDNRYFCCDICIFKTVQLKKLIQHRRMHTGEKPHLCPHCAYRSARRDNLRSHVRRVHKKENLYCDTFSPRGLLLAASVSSSGSQDGPNSPNVGPVGPQPATSSTDAE